MKFERDKLYKARNGSVWRVVCVNGPSKDFPVIAAGISGGGPISVTTDGRQWLHQEKSENDLIAEYREPREWAITEWMTGELGTILPFRIGLKPGGEVRNYIHVREVIDETK